MAPNHRNEGLYYGSKVDHSLLNPNQLRYHGVEYNNNPFHKSQSLGISNDIVLFPQRSCLRLGLLHWMS